MRRLRVFLIVGVAALVAAAVLYVGATLPPATRHLAPAPATTIYGAYHIHTDRSDGSGSLDDVARGAADAGLQFVVVTDHDDATRAPEPPHYRHGVLVIDAVEISTAAGHLVALGLREASLFPLGGEARDTIEDVRRMGGWTIAAHPDSPRPALRWRGRVEAIDGIEWINADSEWRDEPRRLLTGVGHYLVRAPEAIAAIFDRPDTSLRRWDQLSRTRSVVALAGVDAHARIGLDETAEPRQAHTILALPSYEDMFRTLVQAIELPSPPSGIAGVDAEVILSALKGGRTYSVVRALASPGRVAFTASDGSVTRGMGESLPTEAPVAIRARVPEPSDATVALWRNGVEVASGRGDVASTHTGPEAVYRVEVRLPGHAVPWIVTNAIRVGMPPADRGPAQADGLPPIARTRPIDDLALWAVEKHAASAAVIGVTDGEVSLGFRLAPGPSNSQYAAMAFPLSSEDSFDRVTFTIRASAPMRASVQVRLPLGQDGERWQRSVYADTTPRTMTLRLQDFEPAGSSTSRRPIVTRLRSLLIVVDTVHTSPGAEGTLWISGVSLGAPAGPAPVTSGR